MGDKSVAASRAGGERDSSLLFRRNADSLRGIQVELLAKYPFQVFDAVGWSRRVLAIKNYILKNGIESCDGTNKLSSGIVANSQLHIVMKLFAIGFNLLIAKVEVLGRVRKSVSNIANYAKIMIDVVSDKSK